MVMRQQTGNRRIRLHKKLTKKAMFFTMDALLASVILVGGLLLISQHLLKEHPQESLEYLTMDVLSAISELKMSDIQGTNSSYFNGLVAQSSYTNENLSILEQLGTYWANNSASVANNLSGSVLDNLFPANMGLELLINDSDVLYNKSQEELSNLVTSSRMITGVMQGSPLSGSTSSAYLRRIEDKRTNSFAYFGGFVGQGKVTVRLDNLPPDISASTVWEMFLEGEFDSDFDLLVNDQQCRFVNVNNAEVNVFNATNCSGLLQPGDNTVTLDFTEGLTNASVSGGLLGVRYVTNEFGTLESTSSKKIFLPDIDGVINFYDGFMVPGNLQTVDVYLHYWVAENVTLPIYMDTGNTSLYHSNTSGEITQILTDGLLSSELDYNAMSNTTVPIRLGFFSGNGSNSTGNVSDVFLLTSRHNSMGTNDIVVTSTTNVTRIVQAKSVDNLSVSIVLNGSGNRVGLVSFGTGASVDLDSTLTTNTATLYSKINAYAPHPADAQRYLCGAMETAKTQLITNCVSNNRKCAVILMTDGDLLKSSGNTATCAFGQTNDRATVWRDAVHQACNFTDATHGNHYNITFYTVAFGPGAANDPAIIGNLTLMANCTGGKFAKGSNASELSDIYTLFANELAASSIIYTFQRATSATNVESHLYGDSYIEISYVPPSPAAEQSQIPIIFQTEQFGTCSPTVNIPEGVTVVAANLVSYSGDYWTKRISLDGNVLYNLSQYSVNYTNLGDPFQLLVMPELLTSGDHLFNIVLGPNATTDAACSLNDSLIYTGLVSAATNRSVVLPSTEGCNWLVESEDIEFQNISVPEGYAGTKSCNYTNASIYYDHDDAYDAAAAQLLAQLDPDRDGRVSINFAEEDLEITVTLVSDVPYLWGPVLVKAKVWQ